MSGRRRQAPKAAKGRTDWKRIAKLSNAEIERMAARDADNPGTKKADWAKAFIGAPPLKTPVNAKFDVDVVEWFRSQGRGYQARMNAVLRRYMEVHRKTG
ncbi:MAG: BrnA antitoxin family protein [Alphaproteobacteria bacterium]|nr:BrnA antitoxin family protein [Alphaproteobacteria bacterium]